MGVEDEVSGRQNKKSPELHGRCGPGSGRVGRIEEDKVRDTNLAYENNLCGINHSTMLIYSNRNCFLFFNRWQQEIKILKISKYTDVLCVIF